MKTSLIIILSIALAGCSWIIDPGDTGKQYEHTLTEVYYFDIGSDSLHLSESKRGLPLRGTLFLISKFIGRKI